MTAGASSTSRSTRAPNRSAASTASVPPRLEPTSVAGASPVGGSSDSSCSSMRVMVSDEKSGWLRSGHSTSMPCSCRRSVTYATFVDFGDEANPWR